MIVQETASMLTRDGVRLDADIYRPSGPGKFPVLLMRQPYGRAIASTVVYAHPQWYAQQGYIVVIQDVRGRGTSEGVFQLFAHELEDGLDTVNWAANLPHSNGYVGMYGFSYQGMTQIYAASGYPQALKTLCPAMVACDLYQDWAYEGGAFCWQVNLAWGIQLATETARLRGDELSYRGLYNLSRHLPLYGEIPASPETFKNLAADSFYHDWLQHDQPGDYWQHLSPSRDNLDLPMLHIGGWFDTYLRGTVHFYQDMANRSSSPQYLIIGPWGHLPWGRQVGGIDYGPEAVSPIDELQIRWFDHFLKGIDTGLLEEKPVTLFSMGDNCWREFDQWPQGSSQSYFLTSTGLAAIRSDSGLLLPEDIIAVEDEEEDQDPDEHILPDTVDVLVHDPFRPVPALGGHATLTPGSFDRRALDCRADVLTYTSDALDEDLHLAGNVFVEVYGEADSPSFDLCAILSEVRSDGSVWNFTQGYIRVNQPTTPIRIDLQPTCICIPQSHQIRLSLSGACFPAYPVNPGTGQPPSQTRLIDGRIITISLKSGNSFMSRIVLSVDADQDRVYDCDRQILAKI
ncbi:MULTISPECIES: CocE/NonD family hydrolase [Oscillatoriales]|uniref:Peptidase S15 n=1 Tax=Limnospira maxima CS-328 TaxID=513049 RepID=B5W928_LIMMA|nr:MULTISPECIES: CocE/NonD family hydrolase [Oscillatoriales]EKD09575.1 peptidase S15 [Arthrospira platensis C1]MBD2709699.1 CocE/NonD family hydrolase [Arthrospira platensis FACHB-835]MDC0839679.1 CocE/NonD family hydrolase [Limnoraphis robusta]MDT9308844.1 CocE/NonD family hydrolase [Limnospira sp. Paracas R14]MDY7052380.1 CocE/NonD family hydrolase [Limnospira fusiformis LS22]QJB28916.1 CocE/NonD family hydrolase [Limnospira fusiformis SAG 85.79]